jgi:hypothetical protein
MLEFNIHQEQMLSIIKTNIHLSILVFIKAACTPINALKALAQQFQPAGTAHFLATTRRLFTLWKCPEQSIATYFADINNLVATAFPDIGNEIPNNANHDECCVALVVLRGMINKWVLTITLSRLRLEYNTTKAIIQDWAAIDLERIHGHIHKCKLKVKNTSL